MYPNQITAIVLSVVPLSVAGVRERTVRSAAAEAVAELGLGFTFTILKSYCDHCCFLVPGCGSGSREISNPSKTSKTLKTSAPRNQPQ